MEEEVEWLLENDGYIFSDDGTSYQMRCPECKDLTAPFASMSSRFLPAKKNVFMVPAQEALCIIPNDEFTTCCFEWSNYYEDLTPAVLHGKRMNVSENGNVAFHDVVMREPCLDMN
jgi:hypothetical protein